MTILRVVPNLAAPDLDDALSFYRSLGFEVVMNLDWIMTLSAPDRGGQLSLLRADPSGLHPELSLEVDNVDALYAQTPPERVVYDLRDEPWGVRRFFLQDVEQRIINVLQHRSAP